MHKRMFKVDVKKIGGDTEYSGTANRNEVKADTRILPGKRDMQAFSEELNDNP